MLTKANIPNTDVLLREVQRFRQLWLWILLIAVISFSIYNLAQQTISIISSNYNSSPDIVTITVSAILGIGLPIFFYILNLTTEIHNNGIYLRFFPIQHSFRLIRYEDLKSYEETKYHAIKEYGGWGMRCGRRGKAYTVFGNRGVKIDLKNGDQILIGSQRPEELIAALDLALAHRK